MAAYTLILAGGLLIFAAISGKGRDLYTAFGLPPWWDTAPKQPGTQGSGGQGQGSVDPFAESTIE